jgi:DNA-binding transcriptional regulator YhcF (GntR family)
MNLPMKIEKLSDSPVYRQIIESKAYQELERSRIVAIIQGRGTFVAQNQDIYREGRKEAAVSRINGVIAALEALNFSHREIANFFHIILMEREHNVENLHVAAIDCNPESLTIFEQQLRYMPHISIHQFILDDLASGSVTEESLGQFDLILTTSTHYAEILGFFPGLKEKILQAAVSPSQQTVIDLAKISASSKIAVLCKSRQFLQIIKERLDAFQIDPDFVSHMLDEELDYHVFLSQKDVLIVPPEQAFEKHNEFIKALAAFKERGGHVIHFDYQIDRGTLIRIEEEITRVLSQKRGDIPVS